MTHVNRPRQMVGGVATALGLAAVSVQAASVAPAMQAAAPLEEVTVYARRLQPVTRIAATVTVIDAGDIDRTLASDVKEMVRYAPGLSVSSDPFRFGLDTFTIRGVAGNRVAVDVDGIPSAPGFTIGNYSNSGRAFVDLAFVQRVEVLRGPASSLYGSEAIGGVVAMTTFKPVALLGDGAAASLRAQGGYDSADDGWRASVLAAARAGPADVLAGYVHRQGQEPETAADVTPDRIDYVADSMLLTAQFDSTPGGPLTLTAEGGRLHQTSNVDAWELLTGSRFVNTTLLRGDDSGERFRVSASQVLGASAAYDSADWALYWQGTDTSQRTIEQRRAIVKPKTPPTQYDRQFQFDEHVLGAEFTAVKDIETGRWTNEFVYGVELSGLRMEERRDTTVTDLETGETSNTIPSIGETYPLRDFPVTDVVQAGFYAQDEVRFGDGAWSFIPALR
ncbi:MAG: TonB-dependent receptor plug domain-containing protein, partial [Steroidobacteraceae bacterium]